VIEGFEGGMGEATGAVRALPVDGAGELSRIVGAYDIRGLVPGQLDEPVAAALGAAFAEFCGPVSSVVVGRDMRDSSPRLAAAFAAGVTSRGPDVIDIGLACTDAVYYASGRLGHPGAMFTASHNPARYNGIKLCRAGAAPISLDTGLAQIRDRAAQLLARPDPAAVAPGSVVAAPQLIEEYAGHLHSLVDTSGARPLRVVIDAGNGMAGHVVPIVFAGLPFKVVPLYFELDGSFPNHEPNPIDPRNLRDLSAAVVCGGADLGLAFDGDADRCFVVDERGRPVSPSAISGLIAVRELAAHPGAAVVHNLITSRAFPEVIAEHGGRPIRTRVGHSFIKAVMAEQDAVFGGEHSGHYYFRDFWFADSGMLAALHVLAALGELPAGSTCSALVSRFERYVASGEINSTVPDPAVALAALRGSWERVPGAVLDDLDGLTVTLPDGAWFNVRPSNTEPLLRLNVEAARTEEMTELRDRVLAQIRVPTGPDGARMTERSDRRTGPIPVLFFDDARPRADV
jgi:phosphomannomutase